MAQISKLFVSEKQRTAFKRSLDLLAFSVPILNRHPDGR